MTNVSVKYTCQEVISKKIWIPKKLFSIRITRDDNYQFQSGQFARIGIPINTTSYPELWRAYSMVSAPHESYLEFYSIIISNGLFSPRFSLLCLGDSVYIDKKPYGFLTIDRFKKGGVLWLLSTGTGLSAYISILRDPKTWMKFHHIILVHGVREAKELAYREELESWNQYSNSSRYACKFSYLSFATREKLPEMPQARLTTLISDGRLEKFAREKLNPIQSKVMLCGNPKMLTEAKKLLIERGFYVGRNGIHGNLAIENYW